jgi:hypothetical protein
MEKPSPSVFDDDSDLLSTRSGTKFALLSSLTNGIGKQAA